MAHLISFVLQSVPVTCGSMGSMPCAPARMLHKQTLNALLASFWLPMPTLAQHATSLLLVSAVLSALMEAAH